MSSLFKTISAVSLLLLSPSVLIAADANPLDTDPNVNGLVFGRTDTFADDGFTLDDTGAFNGNQILVQSQNVTSNCCHGAGVSDSSHQWRERNRHVLRWQ